MYIVIKLDEEIYIESPDLPITVISDSSPRSIQMATFPLVAANVKPGGGVFGAIRSWMTLTRSYFNPMATPQPMTENDIQKHLYPVKAPNIECRIISNDQEA